MAALHLLALCCGAAIPAAVADLHRYGRWTFVARHPGVLDVTAAPFHVDNTGRNDVTAVLQTCIEAAYSAGLAIFLPHGRYLVSDTLVVKQIAWTTDHGGLNIVPSRFHANVVIGSTAALPARPTIVLRRCSPGFGNASRPKNVMNITNPYSYAENDNMNQVIRGVDFEVEEENSGAVALYFHGAQGSAAQDITVWLASDALAGFGGGHGAGGSHVNVAVHGGRFGVMFLASEPSPVLAGVTLTNQSESAVLWGSQGSMVLVGVRIEQALGASGPAVQALQPITVIDAIIKCAARKDSVAIASSTSVYAQNVWTRGCATLVQNPPPSQILLAPCDASDLFQRWAGAALVRPGVASDIRNEGMGRCLAATEEAGGKKSSPSGVRPCQASGKFQYTAATKQLVTDEELCLDVNGGHGPAVYFYSCHQLKDSDLSHQQFHYRGDVELLESVSAPGHCVALRDTPGRVQPSLFPPRLDGYTLLRELARGVDIPMNGATGNMDVVYADGVRHAKTSTCDVDSSLSLTPPEDLVSRHVAWDEATFPSFETPAVADAVRDCGARGDGVTDDTKALQACLDAHLDVFLPKGHFRLSATLRLRPKSRLVGLSQTHSILMPASRGLLGAASQALPLVTTAAGAPATLAFVAVLSWWHLPVFTLDWRARGGLWRNNYETRVCECLWLANYRRRTRAPACEGPRPLAVPKTQVRGSGHFYNFVNDEDILFTDHRLYRNLLVSNNSEGAADRLAFYSLNLEHTMSEANMELDHATHVDIFGLKLEGSNTALWARDSSDVSLYGLGGSSEAFPNASYYPADFQKYPPAILRMERTDKYRLCNLQDIGRGAVGSAVSVVNARDFPLTPAVLASYPWPNFEVQPIVDSMWAPWPGYSVPADQWSLVSEVDGPSAHGDRSSQPLDRPILYMRGWPFSDCGDGAGKAVAMLV